MFNVNEKAEEANRLLYPQALKEFRRVTRDSGRGLSKEMENRKSAKPSGTLT